MRVVAYYRYSTANKAQVDNSEARQEENVKRFIYRQEGWSIVDTFVDRAKSGLGDKPELMRMKELVESGDLSFDVLVIDDYSRLSRKSVFDLYEDIGWMKPFGIKIATVKKGGQALTVEEMGSDLSAIVDTYQNNIYSKDLAYKVTTGLERFFKSGEQPGWAGLPPVGYDIKMEIKKKSTLVANEDLPIITKIFEHVLSGGSINSCIPILLNIKKFRENPSLTPNRNSIMNILRRSIYCGIRTYGVRGVGKIATLSGHNHKYVKENPLKQAAYSWDYKPEGFAPAITVDQFNEVQAMLDRNVRHGRPFPKQRQYKYSGRLKCADCGTSLNASIYRDKDNKKMIRYVCPRSYDSSRKCKDGIAPKRKQVRTDELDEMIAHSLFRMVTSIRFHENTIHLLCKKITEQSVRDIEGVRENYEIQKARLSDLIRLSHTHGLAALEEEIVEQSRITEVAKKKADESALPDEYLQFAIDQYEQQYIDGEKKDGLAKLMAVYYSVAARVVENKEKKEWPLSIHRWAKRIAKDMRDMVERSIEENHGKLDAPARKVIIQGIKFPYSPEQTLQILDSLALKHISISFELGEWRGRPRRVPKVARLVFAVAAKGYTDKSVVIGSNQLEFVG